MHVDFQADGNLIVGIHLMEIDSFEDQFCYNERRRILFHGLKKAIGHLKDCGCTTIYIDGSFVTKKEFPGDFDACWELKGVDLARLKNFYPILIDFADGRRNQKNEYLGELFLAELNASPYDLYIDFFQKDRDGNPKGIVQINII